MDNEQRWTCQWFKELYDLGIAVPCRSGSSLRSTMRMVLPIPFDPRD